MRNICENLTRLDTSTPPNCFIPHSFHSSAILPWTMVRWDGTATLSNNHHIIRLDSSNYLNTSQSYSQFIANNTILLGHRDILSRHCSDICSVHSFFHSTIKTSGNSSQIRVYKSSKAERKDLSRPSSFNTISGTFILSLIILK
jgi:hypothetical protein